MQKAVLCLVMGMSVMGLLAGCIPSEPVEEYEVNPESITKTPEEMLEEWMAYAIAPDLENSQNIRPFTLTDQLAATSPTALAPCIELLGKPDTSPDTKVFVLQCVTVNMTPAYIPYIKPLLNHENPDTRSCAYTLLGGILDPSIPGLLEAGLKDEVQRVAFAALSGLAIHNIEPARSEFMASYWDEDTTANQRQEILRVIFKMPTENELKILSDFITNADTSDRTRFMIAMIFGRIGTDAEIEALQKSVELSTDEAYKDVVESAEALILERGAVTSA